MSDELVEVTIPERRHINCVWDNLKVEERSSTDGEGYDLVGHAAVFDSLSHDLGGFKEKIARGAFRKALKHQDDVRLLVNHEGLPLARTKNNTLQLQEDPKGLLVRAQLADTSLANDVKTLIKRGDIDQMSFAFSVKDNDCVDTEYANNQNVRTVREVSALYDVSIVTYPAYEATQVIARNTHGNTVQVKVPKRFLSTDTAADRAEVDDTPDDGRWVNGLEQAAKASRAIRLAQATHQTKRMK